MKDKPKPHGLIWKLIAFWKPTYMQLIAIVGFYFLFKFVMQTETASIILIVSMFLHEVGHAIVLWKNHIKVSLLFLFPLGAVAAPSNEEENKRSDLLPGNTLSWLMHSGILVNIGLMGLGTLLALSSNPAFAEIGKETVYVNMMLASFNILPVWTLDSGQLFGIFFASLEDKNAKGKNEDYRLLIPLLVFAIALLSAIVIAPDWRESILSMLKNGAWVGYILVFIVGVIRKASKDDIKYTKTGRQLTKKQLAFHLCIYFLMVIAIFGIPAL